MTISSENGIQKQTNKKPQAFVSNIKNAVNRT